MDSSFFDLLRSQGMTFEELRRIQQLLVERLLGIGGTEAGAPAGSGEDMTRLLRRLQALLLQHPLAAQAAFSALVAEGRRFAATPEGGAWKAALASSELVKQGRQLWDALALNLLEEDTSTVLPSAYLEAFFQAATSPELEAVLRQLRQAGTGGAP